MSNLLNIGRSGLRAFSRSMDAVSHNIANAENPDYVRRSVQMSDATVSSALNPAYLSQTGLNGVRIAQGYLSTVPERTVRVRIKGEKGLPGLPGKTGDAGKPGSY